MSLNEADLLKLFNKHTRDINKFPPRPYLGLSSIGDECLRKIFYRWRFAKYEVFPPRILRLFSRGHQEEPRFVDLLRGAGFKTLEVDPNTGKQFEIVWFHGHCKGHCDGFAFINNEWHLIEMKTMSNKSWLKFKRATDLAISNFTYYAQMQCYMKGFNLKKGLFLGVNKDDDNLYLEFIAPDKGTVSSMEERCVELCTTKTIPQRCSQNSVYWKCSMCWYAPLCFDGEIPNRTCRLCQHVELEKDGKWSCPGKDDTKEILSIKQQRRGCKGFLLMEG